MRLKSGQPAVPFTAQTVDGDAVSLAQFAGKPLLLMFFRYASCPMCNLRLHDVAQQYARLQERGLVALAFFHSSASSIRAHAAVRHYPFSLIADPEFRVYSLYAVETSWPRLLLSVARPSFYMDWLRSLRHRFWGGVAWQMATMPADFLIGPDGRIVEAYYGRDIGDHLPFPRIEALLSGGQIDRATGVAGGPMSVTANAIPKAEVPVQPFRRVVVWSLVWALALVGSSFLLRGLAIGDWVDALLYLSAGVAVSGYVMRRPNSRCA